MQKVPEELWLSVDECDDEIIEDILILFTIFISFNATFYAYQIRTKRTETCTNSLPPLLSSMASVTRA